jgi:benzoyl-CoA reductase/2-hydroxyglutaryl-CoA dehydratase subunit BcrC/BadD/HgdB
MIKSALGSLALLKGDGPQLGLAGLIAPTTCDWIVKFPEPLRAMGLNVGPVMALDLPHGQTRDLGQKKWLKEVYGLNSFLAERSGAKIARQDLLRSINVYRAANRAFSRLIELKRQGRLAQIWFGVLAGSFFGEEAESWVKAIEELLPLLAEARISKAKAAVYLTGSPIFFPNFKVLRLIDEAGLTVVKDDLCSMERLLTGPVHYGDPSMAGLMEALAQRYQQGCQCPTCFDADRRVGNLAFGHKNNLFQGLIHHALKGCHPFSLESLTLERALTLKGLKFLRLETDHSPEDSGPLLTRLEAFRSGLAAFG